MSSLEISTNEDVCESQSNDEDYDDGKLLATDEHHLSEREHSKLRHWKESDYATGLVEPSWADEWEVYKKAKCCGCGCIYLSALICSRFGAGRIGNMAVLKERYVMVEAENDDYDDEYEDGNRADGFVDDDDDEEVLTIHQRNITSKTPTQLVRKREIQLIVGPFWPLLIFITYPLIFGMSAFTLYRGFPGKPLGVQMLWALLTLQLIRSLFNTGFRDPGIVPRRKRPPSVRDKKIGSRFEKKSGRWKWDDRVHSYRPNNATYCTDCKVVVEDFDHT
jgi:hypothetical protein